MAKSTGKKGGKKVGRGMKSPSHTRYTSEDRREKNKIRKAKKHRKNHPNDKTVYKGT